MLGHCQQSRNSWHASAMSMEPQEQYHLYYRPIQPSDYDQIKALHADLFPIDYEDSFYQKVVNSDDRVFSYAAVVSSGVCGPEQVVGFVTARLVYAYECDPLDRQYMDMSSRLLDTTMCVYILTLGVVDAFRQRGLAKALLGLVYQHACQARCRSIFLHVITYNESAIKLYMRSNFTCAGQLQNFYHISTGRQPDPSQQQYDAYLYVLNLPVVDYPPATWGMLNLAVAPLRQAWGHINACMPWFCRNQLEGAFGQVPPHYHPATSQQQLHYPSTLPPQHAQMPQHSSTDSSDQPTHHSSYGHSHSNGSSSHSHHYPHHHPHQQCQHHHHHHHHHQDSSLLNSQHRHQPHHQPQPQHQHQHQHQHRQNSNYSCHGMQQPPVGAPTLLQRMLSADVQYKQR